MNQNPARPLNLEALGHLAALTTETLWGLTFLSAKILLPFFSPPVILLIRLILASLAFALFFPRRPVKLRFKQELPLILAGLFGICLVPLMQNIALQYTSSANVGIIVSLAPCLAALLEKLSEPQSPRLGPAFFIGFGLALCGVWLISFNGAEATLHLTGDLLALLSALVWALYTLLVKQTGKTEPDVMGQTGRLMGYGLLFTLPTLFLGAKADFNALFKPEILAHLLFLGLGASALCFALFNFAIKAIGVVKTSAYIYVAPVVTVLASVLFLGEGINMRGILGILLALAGLAVSNRPSASKAKAAS